MGTPVWRASVVRLVLRNHASGGFADTGCMLCALLQRVVSVLGQNPAMMTLNGTNCYLVGTGPRRILIDTGEAGANCEKMLPNLAEAMQATGCTGLDMIILTHMHHDHFGGVDGVQKRFGCERCVNDVLALSSALNIHRARTAAQTDRASQSRTSTSLIITSRRSTSCSSGGSSVNWIRTGRSRGQSS